MDIETPAYPMAPPSSPRWLPALLLLFVGSGCAALIYEIVWFQLLGLVIGSSAVSLGVLLATFMGGMCLGSLALPHLVSPRRHPLRVYALLELAIAALGLLVLVGMPTVSGMYVSGFASGLPGILWRGAVCGVCLLPPTILMGATLPAIARWVESTPRGISWLGLFYGGNIAGAVVGCLMAGFYLLRVHDLAVATCCAAAINVVVGFAALALASVAPYTRTAPDTAPEPDIHSPAAHSPAAQSPPGGPPPGGPPSGESQAGEPPAARRPRARIVHAAIALSGLTALGAEVVWTRLLSLLLGGTVYTFSIILAVFLIGLGAGSAAGAALSRRLERPRLALAACQMLVAAGIAWTAFMIARSLPYWPVNPSLSQSPWFTFQIDIVRCLWAMLPPAFLWGASFPLALAAAASSSRGEDTGRVVGRLYAANTLGAIVGAVAFSMLVIPLAGTLQAQRLLIGISTLSAILVLALEARGSDGRVPHSGGIHSGGIHSGGIQSGMPHSGALPSGKARAALALASAAAACVLIGSVAPTPPGLVAYGRFFATYTSMPKFLYVGEGLNSSVAVSELPSGVRNFHVSGKVEASTEPQDMRLQNMLGNFAAVFHPCPRSVLVVGLGAGVTAGSFVPYPEIRRIVICEIEPLVPRVVSRYFVEENHGVIADPRVELVHDDARHYLLTTEERFDIITSDPIHPWVKGAAALYTREYFELVKRRLNPGGLVTQWVPLYESDSRVVKSELATFFAAFPDGTIWGNDEDGAGYDTVLLGGPDGMRIDVDRIVERMNLEENYRALESLGRTGFDTILRVLATYAGRGRDLEPWLRGAEINHDRDMRLQYLAGLDLNLRHAGRIYGEILSHRKFPEDLFVASPEDASAISEAMGLGPSRW